MFKGLIYSLLAALVWGLSPVLEKKGLRNIPPLYAVLLRSISISIALIFYFTCKGLFRKVPLTDFRSLSFIILGGLLAGMLGQIFYFTALKNWEASRVVPIAGSYPLVAFIFSLLILREPLTIYKLLGLLLIIGGIYLISL